MLMITLSEKITLIWKEKKKKTTDLKGKRKEKGLQNSQNFWGTKHLLLLSNEKNCKRESKVYNN